MIDKSLVRMIDETLREKRNVFGFCRAKMLEVRAICAHLMDLLFASASPSRQKDSTRIYS